jgi:hypothetical protein
VQLDPLALADDETLVCRCERVTLAEVHAAREAAPPAEGTRALKALLRCGMGACQGAYCAAPLRAALGTSGDLDVRVDSRVRPPIVPVRVGEIARLSNPS